MATALPLNLITTVNAQSTTAPYQIVLDTTQVQAIRSITPAQPDFDTDVLQPLRAKQSAEAARVAAQAARKSAAKSVTAPVGDDAFAQLRYCEAGGIYDRNSGNGYYGAYQYSISTWNNYGGYARADLAPAAVQDEKAHADVARRGFTPWPSCARRLGLL
ncbi:MAG TPA: transglycosylase family protein [Candidatus Saccharimonadia bacterium]